MRFEQSGSTGGGVTLTSSVYGSGLETALSVEDWYAVTTTRRSVPASPGCVMTVAVSSSSPRLSDTAATTPPSGSGTSCSASGADWRSAWSTGSPVSTSGVPSIGDIGTGAERTWKRDSRATVRSRSTPGGGSSLIVTRLPAAGAGNRYASRSRELGKYER